MKLGIVTAGAPAEEALSIAGDYADMIRDLLGPTFTYHTIDPRAGDFLNQPLLEGYVISGSSSSAYDDDCWIARLETWLRKLPYDLPVIGICFGHQLMAKALGGRVQRAEQGLAIGYHSYDVIGSEGWMSGGSTITLPVVHYDQVVELPPSSRLVAGSNFCRFAVLADRERRWMSVQAHPEFGAPITRYMIGKALARDMLTSAEAEASIESMATPSDGAQVAAWIRSFLLATPA